MPDRQFTAARMVADTHRRLAPPLLFRSGTGKAGTSALGGSVEPTPRARIPDTRSSTLARSSPRARFAAALQEGVVHAEAASADSARAHEAARRPRLGLSHPRIDGNYRSGI
jgi:hypothetical protein